MKTESNAIYDQALRTACKPLCAGTARPMTMCDDSDDPQRLLASMRLRLQFWRAQLDLAGDLQHSQLHEEPCAREGWEVNRKRV
jgi:hypothetical protein